MEELKRSTVGEDSTMPRVVHMMWLVLVERMMLQETILVLNGALVVFHPHRHAVRCPLSIILLSNLGPWSRKGASM